MSTNKQKREWLPLDRLVQDPRLQMRVALSDGLTDPVTVERYQEAIEAGEEFPPLEVVFDGKKYWLFDGFQRAAAMKRAKKGSADCIVYLGSRQDALLRAIAANSKHGLTRTQNDCRRALTTLIETPELLQKVLSHAKDQGGVHIALAKACCISKGLVYKVLEERNLRVIGGKLVKKRDLPARQTPDESNTTTQGVSNKFPSDDAKELNSATVTSSEHLDTDASSQRDSDDMRELERARSAITTVWNACRKMLEGRFKSHLLRCAANHRVPIILSDSSRSQETAKLSGGTSTGIAGWEPLEKIEAVIADLAATVCGGLDLDEG